MCLSPITIKNANFGALSDVCSSRYVSDRANFQLLNKSSKYFDRVDYCLQGVQHSATLRNQVAVARTASDNNATRYLSLKDCSSRFIQVPCGSCSECASTKQNYFSQRCYLQGLETAVFMCTLTASDEFMEHYELNFRSGSSNADNCPKAMIDVPFKFYEKFIRTSSQLPDGSIQSSGLSDLPEDDDLPSEFLTEEQIASLRSSFPTSSPSVDSSTTFPFLPYRYVQNFIKRLRKRGFLGNFKYSLCYEFGGKKRRPHYHILFYCPFERRALESYGEFARRMSSFAAISSEKVWREWAVNVGTRKMPIYKNISLFKIRGAVRSPFDFHFVNPYNSKNGSYDTSVFYYTSKYMFKFSDWFNRLNLKVKYYGLGDFREWRRVCCPKVRTSKRLGCSPEALARVCDMVKRSFAFINSKTLDIHSPLFVCSDGSTAPLSPYYQKKLPSELFFSFYETLKHARGVLTDDWPMEVREVSDFDYIKRADKSARLLSHVASLDVV